MELAKLERIELRKIWKHEALNFTNWLAKEENILELSSELGIEIKILQTEASVGSFNVDILAEEKNSERKVIIENQLEKTDHDHLGKLITYASGYNAEIIIWIVKQAREEHQNAINWLNDNIGEKINFFLIEIELWKIGNSKPAPKFRIISRPNDWAKTIKSASDRGELTNTKALQLEFWEQFKEYGENKKLPINLRKPRPQHWNDISYGTSNSHLSITIDTLSKTLNCQLYIPDNMKLFKKLFENKSSIENEIGLKLDWQSIENKKASKINLKKDAFELKEKEKWIDYFKWTGETIVKFKKVFIKYI